MEWEKKNQWKSLHYKEVHWPSTHNLQAKRMKITKKFKAQITSNKRKFLLKTLCDPVSPFLWAPLTHSSPPWQRLPHRPASLGHQPLLSQLWLSHLSHHSELRPKRRCCSQCLRWSHKRQDPARSPQLALRRHARLQPGLWCPPPPPPAPATAQCEQLIDAGLEWRWPRGS